MSLIGDFVIILGLLINWKPIADVNIVCTTAHAYVVFVLCWGMQIKTVQMFD